MNFSIKATSFTAHIVARNPREATVSWFDYQNMWTNVSTLINLRHTKIREDTFSLEFLQAYFGFYLR